MKSKSSELFYCVRCREKQKAVNVKPFITANNRHALKGECSVCGTKVVKFVKG